MPETPEKPTLEQATGALHQILAQQRGEEEPAPETPEQPPVQAEAPAQEPAPEPVAEEPAAKEPEPETDDVISLKQRLENTNKERDEEKRLWEERWKAVQSRASENERILRERYLRKSGTVEKAYRIIKAMNSDQGAPETDVHQVLREIESTMNPASASYVAPVQVPEATEDQAITLNRFLNEKNMTIEEANQFGQWLNTEGHQKLSPQEQEVARESLTGFLRIAHPRWRESATLKEQEAKRAETVNAVKTIQRTQKEAAKAASAVSGAPRKQPAGQRQEIDFKKFTKADVAALFKAAVEENR